MSDVIPEHFYSTPRVNNAYWQQYFKVMLDNIEFASSDETQYGYYVLVNLFGNKKKYMICEDGYVRIEQDDNTILRSDKKVDAPKIFLIALLFRRVQQSAPYDQNYYLTYSNETPFRLHEKTITVKKEEVEKLLRDRRLPLFRKNQIHDKHCFLYQSCRIGFL